MGFSHIQFAMVDLNINSTNQTISPQLHVLFDYMFTTITSSNDDMVSTIWLYLITCPGDEAGTRSNAKRQWDEQQYHIRKDVTKLMD